MVGFKPHVHRHTCTNTHVKDYMMCQNVPGTCPQCPRECGAQASLLTTLQLAFWDPTMDRTAAHFPDYTLREFGAPGWLSWLSV